MGSPGPFKVRGGRGRGCLSFGRGEASSVCGASASAEGTGEGGKVCLSAYCVRCMGALAPRRFSFCFVLFCFFAFLLSSCTIFLLRSAFFLFLLSSCTSFYFAAFCVFSSCFILCFILFFAFL
ncbi:hypothetical protein BDV95DRAFT_573755 [Massariosphaeria phaeospora]|uniref:Uncharacterized protein n=1 Tax=Massariosphaeria phaeospora TaxID=100035 RepID=A0A7C8M5P6_9PLEO|nr:hypothetical protein BDV95DRAFT_573755 [Massariosphaeria phaeospora]